MIVHERYLVDHGVGPSAPSRFVPVDFKNVCLCRKVVIDGDEFWAHDPCCEQPGHGTQGKYIPRASFESDRPKHERKRFTSHSASNEA